MPRGKPTLGAKAPMSETARRRVAVARIGKKHSPETRAKIAAALKGRPKTPEHRAAAAAARRARGPGYFEPEAVAARAERTAIRRRWRWKRMQKRRHDRDKLNAKRLGDRELYEDVVRSWGWRAKRKVFRHYEERLVSCGWSAVRGEVLWHPDEPYHPSRRTRCNYALVDSKRWADGIR